MQQANPVQLLLYCPHARVLRFRENFSEWLKGKREVMLVFVDEAVEG